MQKGQMHEKALERVKPCVSDPGEQSAPDTYRVAFCATHHLPMIQPLRSKHFIKGPKVKFSLLQETGKLLCRVTM